MINVSKLKEGIVIDHIRAGHGYKIFQQLGLDRLDDVVVLSHLHLAFFGGQQPDADGLIIGTGG